MVRFEQAVHYVIANTDPEKLGKTKLAKVLFFADLEALRRTGKSITNVVYEKRLFGPMPRDLYHAIESLDTHDLIAQRHGSRFGYEQHQFWATKDPDLEGFTVDEIAILNEVTRIICEHHTAASISDFTHNAEAWEFAQEGEEIPLAAFLSCKAGTASDEEIAEVEAHLGG